VQCTDVFDRGGFRSIYIRDPDDHIVEIATRGPGIAPGPP
jgi:glyoxylase I family protein